MSRTATPEETVKEWHVDSLELKNTCQIFKKKIDMTNTEYINGRISILKTNYEVSTSIAILKTQENMFETLKSCVSYSQDDTMLVVKSKFNSKYCLFKPFLDRCPIKKNSKGLQCASILKNDDFLQEWETLKDRIVQSQSLETRYEDVPDDTVADAGELSAIQNKKLCWSSTGQR